jgi:hypothetical protein
MFAVLGVAGHGVFSAASFAFVRCALLTIFSGAAICSRMAISAHFAAGHIFACATSLACAVLHLSAAVTLRRVCLSGLRLCLWSGRLRDGRLLRRDG